VNRLVNEYEAALEQEISFVRGLRDKFDQQASQVVADILANHTL